MPAGRSACGQLHGAHPAEEQLLPGTGMASGGTQRLAAGPRAACPAASRRLRASSAVFSTYRPFKGEAQAECSRPRVPWTRFWSERTHFWGGFVSGKTSIVVNIAFCKGEAEVQNRNLGRPAVFPMRRREAEVVSSVTGVGAWCLHHRTAPMAHATSVSQRQASCPCAGPSWPVTHGGAECISTSRVAAACGPWAPWRLGVSRAWACHREVCPHAWLPAPGGGLGPGTWRVAALPTSPPQRSRF